MKNVPHQSSIQNIEANLVATLTYMIPLIISILFSKLHLVGWLLIPILVLFLEKKSTYVKYHAAQALSIGFLYVGLYLINWVLSLLGVTIAFTMQAPFVGFMVGGVLGIVFFIIALALGILSFVLIIYILYISYKCYHYETIRIPFLCILSDTILQQTH